MAQMKFIMRKVGQYEEGKDVHLEGLNKKHVRFMGCGERKRSGIRNLTEGKVYEVLQGGALSVYKIRNDKGKVAEYQRSWFQEIVWTEKMVVCKEGRGAYGAVNLVPGKVYRVALEFEGGGYVVRTLGSSGAYKNIFWCEDRFVDVTSFRCIHGGESFVKEGGSYIAINQGKNKIFIRDEDGNMRWVPMEWFEPIVTDGMWKKVKTVPEERKLVSEEKQGKCPVEVVELKGWEVIEMSDVLVRYAQGIVKESVEQNEVGGIAYNEIVVHAMAAAKELKALSKLM